MPDQAEPSTTHLQWETFVSALRSMGLIGHADVDPSDRISDLGLDSFGRAQLWGYVRSLHADIADECLASIETLGDAYGWLAGVNPGTQRPVLGAQLLPVLPEHYPLIYRVGADPAVNMRWRFRGTTPRPSDTGELLHQGTLCHFIVAPPESERPEGYVALYNPHLSDGYAYFGFQRLQTGRPALMYEGVFRFFDYAFASFSLRRIYVEIPGFNLEQFSSVLDLVFQVDGVLEDRDYYDGRYWPLTVAHIDRSHWIALRDRWRPLLQSGGQIPRESSS